MFPVESLMRLSARTVADGRRELRWRYPRRSTRFAARLLRFLLVFTIDRAHSDALSNAYLTVHRIEHMGTTTV